MEANALVFQSTPHRCDAPSDAGHYSNCDRKGCTQSTRGRGNNAYGQGPAHIINTLHPFEVSTTFHGKQPRAGEARFTGLTTRLSQEGRELVLDHERCKGYLQAIAGAMAQGMSLRITYWGEDAKTMEWLDRPPCGEQSCAASAGDAVISNLSVSAPRLPSAPGRGVPAHGPSAPAGPAAPLVPWWVYLFVWVSLLQGCLLCVLGAFTLHLHRQMLRPAPAHSRRPLAAASPPPGLERTPNCERTRSAMLVPDEGGSPFSTVQLGGPAPEV